MTEPAAVAIILPMNIALVAALAALALHQAAAPRRVDQALHVMLLPADHHALQDTPSASPAHKWFVVIRQAVQHNGRAAVIGWYTNMQIVP